MPLRRTALILVGFVSACAGQGAGDPDAAWTGPDAASAASVDFAVDAASRPDDLAEEAPLLDLAGIDGAGAPTPTSLMAATQTAVTSTSCVGGGVNGKDIRPFYWEIGDASGAMASGSVSKTGDTPYTADSVMAIASASKWFYSTYWVQKVAAQLTAADIKYFNFWSGYTNFTSCVGQATVGACLAATHGNTSNGTIDPATVDHFDYGGGHMQAHATLVAGLGALDNAGFASEIKSQVGSDIDLTYNEPQPAGGGSTSAAQYAKLLRKIVSGALLMKGALGTHPVCVDPATCPTAISTPSPPGEQWHYSVGHWVEDDPTVGDGAFSSPGAFGFYPWIDHDKHFYGVVARKAGAGALTSVYCGRKIRKAWLTGIVQ